MPNLNHAPLPGHHSTAAYREAEQVKPYEHQVFPKLVYKGKAHKKVADQKEQDAALAAGFSLEAPKPEVEE